MSLEKIYCLILYLVRCNMPVGKCYFCEGKVQSGQDGVHCTQCGTFLHLKCGKRKELVEETSGGLLSSGGIRAKCPSCGHVGSV